MATHLFTDEELLAYLDELLPPERMADAEKSLRNSEPLRRRLAGLARSRDQGVHSVGAIWRRRRLSCPSRKDWGNYLLGTLPQKLQEYYDFHLRTVGCRFCLANLRDLEQASEAAAHTQQRRQKYFQSSAGYLRRAE
jgi:hypothetical protein